MFGTIGVLGPLRLDDLGVSAAVIGAAWLGAALLESGVSPIVGRVSDRRGRQTAGSAASARLADATSDTVPCLILSALCCVTLAILARARRTSAFSLT